MSATTATLGSATVALAPRSSAIERLEMLAPIQAQGTISIRHAAAVVGWSWPVGPTRPAGRYSGDVAAYGGAVADELLGRGVSAAEIVTAAVGVLDAIVAAGLPGLGAAKEAARPTSAPEGGAPSTT